MPVKPPDHAASPVISVVVPTLNEAANIDKLIQRIVAALDDVAQFEIIVVDDGSTDDTQSKVRSWESRAPVRLVVREDERGLTGAVKRGTEEAEGEVIVVMDADLSHPPENLPELVGPIIADSHDIVIGSRHVDGGATIGWPLRRHITSRVAALLATPFVNVRDPMSGFFATRRSAFDSLSAEGSGFKILLDMLASRLESARVLEVPIEFRDREQGVSKLGAGVMIAYLRQLARLSGTVATGGSAVRFALVGLLGVGVDLSIFLTLSSIGVSIDAAHIASFFVVTILNYVLNDVWSFRTPTEGNRPRVTVGRYVSYLLVCLAALIVRGGVLATGLELGLSNTLAILFAIAFAASVNFLGSAMFVFAVKDAVNPTIRWRLAAVAIVLYSLALRVAYMVAIDLLPEEAYYWNYAKHLDIGYLDHPPMIAWLIGLSTYVLGDSEFAVRLPALCCWFIALGFMCALTNRILGRSIAFVVGALLSTLPFFLVWGLVATPDCPLVACWASALYFLHRAVNDARPAAWFGFGISVGLGLLSKYTIALIGPVALVIILLDKDARRCLFSPYPYLAALIAIILFSPVLLWNAQHEWASFAFQSVRRLNMEPQFALHLLLGSLVVLLTPVGFASAIGALTSRKHDRGGINVSDRRFLFIATLVPLLVFIIFSLRHAPKLDWTGPIWLALLPLMALDLAPAAFRISRSSLIPSLPIEWKVTFMGTFLVFGAGFHYLAIGLPGIPYPTGMPAPVAWAELGQAIEDIKDDLEPQIQRAPIIVVGMDHYFLASELAFYQSKAGRSHSDTDYAVANTTAQNLFGVSGLMYETWTPANSVEGANCILVAYKPQDISEDSFSKYFEELSAIKTITVTKNNRYVHDFVWRLGTGYHQLQDSPNQPN